MPKCLAGTTPWRDITGIVLLFTAISHFLDIDELLSALVQVPKQETVGIGNTFSRVLTLKMLLSYESDGVGNWFYYFF